MRLLRNHPVNLAHPLNRGLTSWWLNLPRWRGGNTHRDLMRRNDGTLTNMDAADWVGVQGRPGGFGAHDFDGTNDYIQTTSRGVEGTAERSTGFWFNTLDSRGAALNFAYSYGGDDGNDAGAAWDISVESGVVFLRVFNGGTSWGSGLNDGAWHHVMLTAPDGGTLASVRAIVDGVDKGLGSGTTAYDTRAGVGSYSNIAIGRDTGNILSYFNGFLDDVTIYDRALSASEVSALYQDSKAGHPKTLNWLRRTTYFIPPAAASGNVKTVNSVAIASVKTVNAAAIASVKTIDTVSV